MVSPIFRCYKIVYSVVRTSEADRGLWAVSPQVT